MKDVSAMGKPNFTELARNQLDAEYNSALKEYNSRDLHAGLFPSRRQWFADQAIDERAKRLAAPVQPGPRCPTDRPERMEDIKDYAIYHKGDWLLPLADFLDKYDQDWLKLFPGAAPAGTTPPRCTVCERDIPDICIRIVWQDEYGQQFVRHMHDCSAPIENRCSALPKEEQP